MLRKPIVVRLSLIPFAALSCLLLAPTLDAQVLITGENGGKGSRAVMVSANGIQAKGFGTLSNNWAQYGWGVTNRFDAFLSYGNITVFGRSQSYAAIGSNIGLLRRSRAGLDVALYNNASIPINHRQQASDVLLISALIASRPVKVLGRTLTLYGGASRQTPIGRAPDPHFTPPSAVHNGIMGTSVSVSQRVAFFVEYNPGKTQRSGGVGFLFIFPTDPGSAEPNETAVPEPSESPERGNPR